MGLARTSPGASAAFPSRRRVAWPLPTSGWSGALTVALLFTAVPWIVQIANSADHYGLDRFGIRPREVDGLWGILTAPFLHTGWGHLLSNTVPLIAIGWVLLLSGVRVFGFVTGVAIVLGDFGTWLTSPSHTIVVGASGLVFGWLGYLLARAWFSRRLKWIVTAIVLLMFFGALLGSLLPTVDSNVSWQGHLCGFVVGVGCAWLLHRKAPDTERRFGPWRAPAVR